MKTEKEQIIELKAALETAANALHLASSWLEQAKLPHHAFAAKDASTTAFTAMKN